jgi:hypothetical protein
MQDGEGEDQLHDVSDVDRRCRRPAFLHLRAQPAQILWQDLGSSRLRNAGRMSRSKIDRRMARVLSAIRAS